LGSKLFRWSTAGDLAVAIVLIAVVAIVPSARADADEVALNGRFTAVSDGQWAQTRESYHDEATVTQTWTMISTCSDFLTCTGRVTSDKGWTGDARYMSGQWRVVHTIQNWEPCADGTEAPGLQSFTFIREWYTQKLTGWDKTTAPSGACGVNQWLTVTMPFELTQIG
jgi:hypothetical protein